MVVADTSGVTSATIANGGTTSAAIILGAYTLAGIQMPDTLTSTTLWFEVSARGNEFVPLRIVADDGTTFGGPMTVAASGGYSLPFVWFAQWSFVRLVLGSAEAADRTIDLTIVAV